MWLGGWEVAAVGYDWELHCGPIPFLSFRFICGLRLH